MKEVDKRERRKARDPCKLAWGRFRSWLRFSLQPFQYLWHPRLRCSPLASTVKSRVTLATPLVRYQKRSCVFSEVSWELFYIKTLSVKISLAPSRQFLTFLPRGSLGSNEIREATSESTLCTSKCNPPCNTHRCTVVDDWSWKTAFVYESARASISDKSVLLRNYGTCMSANEIIPWIWMMGCYGISLPPTRFCGVCWCRSYIIKYRARIAHGLPLFFVSLLSRLNLLSTQSLFWPIWLGKLSKFG